MGTFDLFHPGHVQLLSACRRVAGRGGIVSVGVNTDEFIRQFKGTSPVQSYADRVAMVESCKYVDEVYTTPGPDAKPLIESVKPDFLVIGSDWAPPKDYYGQLQITPAFLEEFNIELLFLSRSSYHSSTELKGRVRGT